jgi:hypothetical protein
LNSVCALGLTGLLCLPPVWAQQALVSQAGDLKIVIIEGEGAKNSIRMRSAIQPVVEVRDSADKPIPGAEVVFQLPAAGPGGVFNGWMRTQTVKTNAEGRAQASGFTPNEEEGRFNIRVTATHANSSGSAVISQANIRGTGSGNTAQSGGGRNWKIWALIGGAALVGGVAAAAASGNGNGNGAPVTNPVVITSGVISVAGPR